MGIVSSIEAGVVGVESLIVVRSRRGRCCQAESDALFFWLAESDVAL